MRAWRKVLRDFVEFALFPGFLLRGLLSAAARGALGEADQDLVILRPAALFRLI